MRMYVNKPQTVLKKWIYANDLNYTKFGEKLGVSKQFISNIINGKAPIPYYFADDIEKITHNKITRWMIWSKNDPKAVKYFGEPHA